MEEESPGGLFSLLKKMLRITQTNSVGVRSDPTASWRLIDRAHGDLVLFSAPQGVVALHLRAAYERIRLEQLEDTLRDSSTASSQTLLLSEPLELDGVDRKKFGIQFGTLAKTGICNGGIWAKFLPPRGLSNLD